MSMMCEQVIPFLPFEQAHIAQVIAHKLEQLDVNYRGVYWHRLWIDVRDCAALRLLVRGVALFECSQ